MPTDVYKSIATPSSGVYRDKGSRFLAFAHPVTSADEVKAILEGLRKEYFDARHHCYAYRIGLEGETYRINDDGEPSSSAGRPIYGQILSHGLSDILVVVVRYFGGTKLGIPGLIKAYKTATDEALNAAAVIEKTATRPVCLRFPYERTNVVMKMLKECSLSPSSMDSGMECSIVTEVSLSGVDSFLQQCEMLKINTIFVDL